MVQLMLPVSHAQLPGYLPQTLVLARLGTMIRVWQPALPVTTHASPAIRLEQADALPA